MPKEHGAWAMLITSLALGQAVTWQVNLLKKGTRYQDLSPDYFDKLNERAAVSRAVARLEALGYTVTLARQDETAA